MSELVGQLIGIIMTRTTETAVLKPKYELLGSSIQNGEIESIGY